MRGKRSNGRVTFALCVAALVAGGLGRIGGQQLPPAQLPPTTTPPAAAAPSAGPSCGGRSSQPQVACPGDVEKMMAALPDKPSVKPKQPRKVLVLAKAAGFVHSSIPLVARTMEEMGKKTGAWTATVSYDPSVITADNLKQYDAIVLDNTTGTYLDDPNDQAATDARRKALMEFVRGGKGLAAIHASIDSYHSTDKANTALWPEYNKMIGAWFKFHWNDPQLIVVKIDDPKSPLTAMFNGQPFEIRDETYTYPMDSFSRSNVHVLTSVDYSKMSDEDKAKEPAATKRTDGDYALSWIRHEGKGRVFVEAHGHSERVYAMTPMLQHMLAGVQYAIGDLPADDAPGAKGATGGQK
jgi:type 1 glutamine amidotransferase